MQIILATLLTNIGFLSASAYLSIDRPIFNLDYAIAILLTAFGFRKTSLALLALFFITDSLSLLSQVLPFPRVADLLYLLSLSLTASNLHLSIIALCLIAISLKLASYSSLLKKPSKLSALVTFNILAAIQVYNIYAPHKNQSHNKHYVLNNKSISSSQTANFYSMRSQLFLSMFENTTSELLDTEPGASLPWYTSETNSISKKLLIVSESWGTPRNPLIQEYIISPLTNLDSHTISRGDFNRAGFTIDGELRELCQKKPSHFNLTKTVNGFEDCLPNRLRQAGYETLAVHGATGIMYGRLQWYPRAGFDQSIFFESQTWPRRCHSFPGACDRDIFPLVTNFFSKHDKGFFYWLTLNSHASYDIRDIYTDRLNCLNFDIPEDSETCRNLKLHAQFFYGLSELISNPSMQNVDLIIVSDHSPVILNKAEKDTYFHKNTIPWIRLSPKQDTNPEKIAANLSSHRQ